MKHLRTFIMWIFRTLLGAAVTPRTKPLKPAITGELTSHDKQTIAYIKLSKFIDRNKYGIYNSDGHLFIVNHDSNQVLLAFYDDVIIVNQELLDSELTLCLEIKAMLDKEFSNLSIVQDTFIIDTDSRAIYIGKAATDYQNSLKTAANEERILH